MSRSITAVRRAIASNFWHRTPASPILFDRPVNKEKSPFLGVIFLALLTRAFHMCGLSDFKEKLKLSAFWGMIIPVVLSGLLGWSAIGLKVGFAAITGSILWYYNRRMGCITGEMLGAITEITKSALFLLMSI